MAIYTDDFDRGDGDLGANWTDVQGSGCSISSNTVKGDATAEDQVAVYTGASFANDHYAIATISSGIGNNTNWAEVWIGATGTGASLDGYFLYTDGVNGAGHTAVGRYDDGSGTEIAALSPATPFAAGHRMKIERVDSGASQVIRVYQDTGGGFTQIGTDISDTTYQSGGYPGVGVYDETTNNTRIDDFEGGNVGDSPYEEDNALRFIIKLLGT